MSKIIIPRDNDIKISFFDVANWLNNHCHASRKINDTIPTPLVTPINHLKNNQLARQLITYKITN